MKEEKKSINPQNATCTSATTKCGRLHSKCTRHGSQVAIGSFFPKRVQKGVRMLEDEEICLIDVCASLIFQWNRQELKCALRQAVAKEIGAWCLLTQMKPFPFGAEIKVRVSYQHSAIRNVPFTADKWWFLHATYCRRAQLALFQLLRFWIHNEGLANCSTKLHRGENYGKTWTVFKKLPLPSNQCNQYSVFWERKKGEGEERGRKRLSKHIKWSLFDNNRCRWGSWFLSVKIFNILLHTNAFIK